MLMLNYNSFAKHSLSTAGLFGVPRRPKTLRLRNLEKEDIKYPVAVRTRPVRQLVFAMNFIGDSLV